MAIIKNINLINFRNFNNLNLSFNRKLNIFFGKNGCGKTNILEAISLISKGRGIRNSNIHNFVKKNKENFTKNETFPAVSLSVKNPVSSKILTILVTLQILSNVGILFFLYLGME